MNIMHVHHINNATKTCRWVSVMFIAGDYSMKISDNQRANSWNWIKSNSLGVIAKLHAMWPTPNRYVVFVNLPLLLLILKRVAIVLASLVQCLNLCPQKNRLHPWLPLTYMNISLFAVGRFVNGKYFIVFVFVFVLGDYSCHRVRV